MVECSNKFENCGGTADRLGPLPLHVRMAAKYERFLLISWRDDRPAPLEEFLLPPVGGIDWRMPEWLLQKLKKPDQKRRIATYMDKILRFGPDKTARWLRVKLQSYNHGQQDYDSRRIDAHDPSFAQVYHDVWRIFFTPRPPIAQRIEMELSTLGLSPGNFLSVHVRALYGVANRDENLVRWWAQNALNCATTKLPSTTTTTTTDLPILFVSDSPVAKEEAMVYGSKHGLPVVHRLQNQQMKPLHLEKDNSSRVEDFYDTFVDVLMIGLGQCTAYNMGGFGRWGSMISYNSSCTFHMKATMIKCELSPQEPGTKKQFENIHRPLATPLFLPPMGQGVPKGGATEEAATMNPALLVEQQNGFNFSQLSYILDDRIFNDPLVYEEYNSTKYGVNLWDRSNKLPTWMKKYFKWHKKQRRNMLTPENWRSMRLLIMECLQHQPKCGGTSDRLKPLPTLLRIAASTNRFLMIHWTRPSRLEEFLLPPKGGMDWRVPDWLRKYYAVNIASSVVRVRVPSLTFHYDSSPPYIAADTQLIDYGEAVTLVDEARDVAASSELGVRAKYQSYDGGQGWYNDQLAANETEFNEVFHDVWRVFFTPSPPIARKLKREMEQKGLAPGEYVAAHLRALYGQETRSAGQTKVWTRNAVNCASKLRPGKPIFFASDSKVASDYSVIYGGKMNGIVATHESKPDPPLHLDKAENFSDPSTPKRPIRDYHDTFIDLYLIALGRCVFISKGGYGQWGLLIGGNTDCVMKFKRGKGRIINPCNWTLPPDGDTTTKRAILAEPLFIEPQWQW